MDGIRSFPRRSCFSSKMRLISRTMALNFCKSCSFEASSARCFKRSSLSVMREKYTSGPNFRKRTSHYTGTFVVGVIDFATTILLLAPDGIKIRTKDMRAGRVHKARGRQPSALSSRLLSRRRSQPGLRHFLLDCGKRRFSRLFFCASHSHTSIISEIQGILLVNVDQVTI